MTRAGFRSLLVVALAAVVIRLAVSALSKGHSFSATEPARPEPEAAYLKSGEMRTGDSEQYLLLGPGIRHRRSFSWDHEPNTLRTPGYPLLLALLNDNVTAIVIVQALLAGLTVFLTGLVGRRLFGSRAGLLGAAMLAVDVPSIFYSGMVMSDVLFTFAVVMAATLIWGLPGFEGPKDEGRGMKAEASGSHGKEMMGTPRRVLAAGAAGLVLGFAVLVRPVALFAFVPFGTVLVVQRNWRGLVLMLAAFSLLPGAWVMRNYHHYHRFGLASIGAYNLLYANAAALKGDELHISWDSARNELAHDFTSKLATDNPLELASAMTRKATYIMLHDPFRYAWMCLRRVPWVVAGIKSDDLVSRMLDAKPSTTEAGVLLHLRRGSPGVRLVTRLLVGFELLTAVGGFLLALVALGIRRWREEKLLLVFVGLYFVAIALPLTDGRFRVPAMPFLYLAAATLLVGGARETEGAAAGRAAAGKVA